MTFASSSGGGENPVHWSDGVYAMWLTTCAQSGISPTSLRYEARLTVTNPHTVAVINRIQIKHRSYTMPVLQPSGPTAESFRALLGTPNGAGPVYALMDHKRSLGKKTIASISIFRPRHQSSADLLFKLKDFSASSPIKGSSTNESSAVVISEALASLGPLQWAEETRVPETS